MTNLKINGQPYAIADNWQEVNINRLVKATTDRQELAALSDIPMDIVSMLDMEMFKPLISFIECVDDYLAPEMQCANVSEESYEKLAEAEIIMKWEAKPYRQVYHISKLYHPERKKSVHILSTGINIVNQMEVFLNSYSEMFQEGATGIEVEAGIESVNELAPFMTPYHLAGKDLIRMKEVLKEPAVVVYSALLCNFRESKYQEELYRLKFPPTTK